MTPARRRIYNLCLDFTHNADKGRKKDSSENAGEWHEYRSMDFMVITKLILRFLTQPSKFFLFLALLCAAFLVPAGRASGQSPRGVFSIPSSGKPIQQAVLSNPDVDGIALRQNWADIEKTDG